MKLLTSRGICASEAKASLIFCQFVSLLVAWIEYMNKGGGIDYVIPHMNKNRLQAEGNLGIPLTISADLLVKTRELIRAAEMQIKQDSQPIPKMKQRNSNKKRNKEVSISFRKPHSVGAGLRNMVNTCFLNATLQCITHTVPLFKKICCIDHSTPCPYDEDGFCSFCVLKEHIEESIQRPRSVLVPARFKDNLSKLSSAFIAGQQEDAHEFLSCLLDNLHMCTLDPKSSDEESIVKKVFGGRLKSELTCRDCGHCSETFERFIDLSLEINQVDDLVAALESFTKVEQLGDAENKLNCGSCNGQVCMDKKLVLDEMPDVVVFQLKRFTNLDGSIEKIDKHVTYPTQLDLHPFHSNQNKEDLNYDLYGVVEHSGLPNFGHYVCTIRSSPSSWHSMNDSLVDSISETTALHMEAYLLFYVRQGRFPWFSNLLQEATSGAPNATEINKQERPKRHNVFTFENLVEEDTHLVPKHKVKKQEAASARLMSGITSARRRCFVKRLDSLDQNASLGF